MKTLTKENFKEALEGNSIVFFHRLKGCGNCDKSLPVVEAFNKDGVEVFDVDVDTEKELVNIYAPNTRWNLPLTVYFENGEAVNAVTETLDGEKLMEVTKTIQNVSDLELQKSILDLEVTQANQKKALFETQQLLTQLHMEANSRMNKLNAHPAGPIQPTPPPAVIKNPIDLSGFPEGQSPDGGGCEGCGDSQQ